MSTPPVVLTIAGSDSGGGAGLQADLTTFAALGVHGACAVTAITVQDTTGVHDIHTVSSAVVVAQVEAVLTDLKPAAVKVGMLGDAGVTRTIADLASRDRLPRLVVDPVLVSTSGQRLAAEGVLQALVESLLPHAALITPNSEEAAALLGVPVATTTAEQADHARSLRRRLGCEAVVVTGGSAPGRAGTDRVDVLVDASGSRVFASPEISTANDHGTGCTFASAAAAFLARGLTVPEAVGKARAFVRHALAASARWQLGAGRGPVAHLRTATSPPFPATPTDPATSVARPIR